MDDRGAQPDKVAGHLEVGTREGEVIVNHPNIQPDPSGAGHLVFSPAQARGLAETLLRQADTADAQRGILPVETVRVLRLIEYVGPRDLIERQVARSIHGTIEVGHDGRRNPRDGGVRGIRIRAATIGDYPEDAGAVPSPFKQRPRIVCICGSTRFIDQHAIKAWEIERDEGAIAVGCHLLPCSYPGVVTDHQAEAEDVAARLDALHRQKIDMADEVYVINVGGYIGERTREELVYAVTRRKALRWLEPERGIAYAELLAEARG